MLMIMIMIMIMLMLMQNAKCNMQNARYKMLNAKCKMQDASLICKKSTLVGALSVVTLSWMFNQVQVKYGRNCLKQNFRLEYI